MLPRQLEPRFQHAIRIVDYSTLSVTILRSHSVQHTPNLAQESTLIPSPSGSRCSPASA